MTSEELWEKDYRLIHGGKRVAKIKGFAYGGLGLVLILLQLAGMFRYLGEVGVTMVGYGLLCLTVEIAVMSARAITTEIRDQTLGALVLIPGLTGKMILKKKRKAILRALWPVGCFIAGGGLLIFFEIVGESRADAALTAMAIFALVWLVGVAHLYFLHNLTVFFSWRVRTGAALMGLMAWFLSTIVMVLLGGFATVLALLIPAGIGIAYLGDKNTRMLESMVEES